MKSREVSTLTDEAMRSTELSGYQTQRAETTGNRIRKGLSPGVWTTTPRSRTVDELVQAEGGRGSPHDHAA